MKKLINTILVLSLLMTASISSARVGDDNPSARDLAQTKATGTPASTTVRSILQNRVEHRWSKMVTQIERAIAKEEEISKRLEDRINKIKTAGGQTTDAEKFLAEAKVHLGQAKTALENLKTLAGQAIEKEDSKATRVEILAKMREMQKALNETKMHIIEAHKSLQKVIGSLRGMSQLNATTTKSN